MAPAYFTFRDFLTADDAARFFELPHASQVAKVAEYLEFLGQQPAAAHFAASPRASTSFAASRSSCPDLLAPGAGSSAHSGGTSALLDITSSGDGDILRELLAGCTRSGFGAFGTESAYLSQKELSLAVAAVVEDIGHEYVVERPKCGEPPVLNSRSFFFYWCHAEKQKLVDIRRKLDRLLAMDRGDRELVEQRRRALWQQLVVVVDRAMCPDCVGFAACLARDEKVYLALEDPNVLRVFPPDSEQSVQVVAVRPSS